MEFVLTATRSIYCRRRATVPIVSATPCTAPVVSSVLTLWNYSRFTRMENGQCVIGMKKVAMIPLIGFDGLVNVSRHALAATTELPGANNRRAGLPHHPLLNTAVR
jgi:hypothetical protein